VQTSAPERRRRRGTGFGGDQHRNGNRTATESDASADAVTVTDAPTSGDESDDSADASRESRNCEAIFSLVEIEEFFAEAAELTESIGDLAYATDSLGPAFLFVDDPVGGSLSYSEIAMGTDTPQLRTADDVEQLFRTFHDRVN